jgi:outer membrane protein OmpA-like peptidoglycan-associated protein
MGQVMKPGVAKALKIGKWALGAIAIFGIYFAITNTAKKVATSQKIDQIAVAATFSEEKVTTSNRLPIPDFGSPSPTGTQFIFEVMEWNAQFPLMYANGGVYTCKNSLFAQNGIKVEIRRQDMCDQMIKDFVENSEALADGKTTIPMVVCFMGDGVPGFSAGLNAIRKLGKDHKAIAFYTMGRSNGEDCFWGPSEWKEHPEKCLGKGVLGVPRDGDINIVLKWAADNNITINANEKVWDSAALNIMPCADFNTELCNKVLNGHTEERDVVVNGQTVPGQKHTLHVDAFTTWTPADVTIAQKKGGFARLASTADFTQQMPNMAIIDAAWAEAHRPAVCSLIKSLGLAGDQVRSFPEAQEFAAKVSAIVYKDKDANYWLKYYRGVTENDKKGVPVFLGGSQSFNLADAAMVFGLGNEATPIDRYRITYETFASILTKLYPVEMKGAIPYDDMVDVSFLREVLQKNDSLRNGKTENVGNEYATGSAVTEQVSKSYNKITYPIGSAVIDKSSYPILNKIFNSAVISEKLTIFIYGHTDALGDDKDNGAANEALSMRRAEAVQAYLHNKGLESNRMQVKGYGSSQPVPSTNGNKNDVNNRCVEIIQGR